jgi:hypothetical protein
MLQTAGLSLTIAIAVMMLFPELDHIQADGKPTPGQ